MHVLVVTYLVVLACKVADLHLCIELQCVAAIAEHK
jgi:hypothetical protein